MWEAIRANRFRSRLLIVVLAAVLMGLGYVIGFAIHPEAGLIGLGAALLVWMVLVLTAATGGSSLLLAGAEAEAIRHEDYPLLFNVVEEMSIAAGLSPLPKVYIIDSDAPNAFAVGKKGNSAVAVTSGLLMRLNRDELQGVIAHEIGHIVNNDTRFMTTAGVTVAAVVLLSDVFLRSMLYSSGRRRRGRGHGGGGAAVVAIIFAILAPVLAQLLYFACSRRREYLADACAARFTRYPPGLASALEKISASAWRMRNVNRALAPMFTVSPLKGSTVHGIFSTHPPTEKRVQVLRAMGGASYAEYEKAFGRTVGEHIIGARTLSEDAAAPVREPSAEPERSELEKTRQVVDVLHRLEGMLAVTCACGLKTRVPPGYAKEEEINCPRCGRLIPLGPAIMAAAAAGAMGREGTSADRQSPRAESTRQTETIVNEPGKWQNVNCSCGHTIQLSPNFSALQVRCGDCGRRYRVVRE